MGEIPIGFGIVVEAELSCTPVETTGNVILSYRRIVFYCSQTWTTLLILLPCLLHNTIIKYWEGGEGLEVSLAI